MIVEDEQGQGTDTDKDKDACSEGLAYADSLAADGGGLSPRRKFEF
jgi:hypothetical protein